MDIAPRTSLLDRFLPWQYREVFADDLTLHDNPILTRDARRDARRKDRIVLMTIALCTILVVFGGMAWLLQWLGSRGALRWGIPAALGHSYGSLVFCAVSAVHIWFVMHTAHRRTHTFFLQEYRQNTLQSLLCTPMRPFQIVLQASVYPFTQAMLVAAAGLPFYTLALSLGGVNLFDLAMLYLFYAMIAWRPPRWQVPVFAGLTPEDILKRQRSGRGAMWSEVSGVNVVWNLMIVIWVVGGFARGWVWYLVTRAWTIVPRDLAYLLAPFPLTWVLWLARLLWTPLPFYSFALPLVVVVVPLYLLARLLWVWESSLFLRSGDSEQLLSLWDLGAYRRTQQLYRGAFLFVMLGYLWKPFVHGGITAQMVVSRTAFGAAGDGYALAGLLYLFGAWAAFQVWNLAREYAPFRRSVYAGEYGEQAGRLVTEWVWTLAPGGIVYGLYVFCCALAGRNPFPPQVLTLLGPLVAVTMAGFVIYRGLNLYAKTFALLPFLPLLAWLIPGQAGSYIAAASPVAGLLSLTPHTERLLKQLSTYSIPTASVAPWYVSVLISGGVGLLVTLIMKMRGPSAKQISQPTYAYGAQSTLIQPPEAVTAAQEPQPEGPAPKKKKPLYANKKEHPLAQRLLAWLQRRQDNAVATKEMRVLFRGHLGPDELIVFGVLMVGLLGLALYYVDDTRQMLVGPARLFFGEGVPESVEAVLGGMASIFTILLSVAVAGASSIVCGTAFGKERDKSTLGFVLVTPLPTEAILAGKLFGMLAPTLLVIVIVSAWNFFLCLPLFFTVGPLPALVGMGLMTAIPLGLALTGGIFGLASASLFRKDSDASGAGILATLLFVFALFYTCYTVLDLWRPNNGSIVVGVVTWVGCLTILGALCAVPCLALTRWRLAAARRGDVAFESQTKV